MAYYNDSHSVWYVIDTLGQGYMYEVQPHYKSMPIQDGSWVYETLSGENRTIPGVPIVCYGKQICFGRHFSITCFFQKSKGVKS